MTIELRQREVGKLLDLVLPLVQESAENRRVWEQIRDKLCALYAWGGCECRREGEPVGVVAVPVVGKDGGESKVPVGSIDPFMYV